ncbi:MAG: OmpA family protein [Elusimicrobia bacterium]|nr:OmpA family protein [Elusimicrobiota bacterium]
MALLFVGEKITPIATIGIGGADLHGFGSSDGKSQSAFAVQGGLGFEYFPVSMFSVGVLGRVHYVLNESMNDRVEATAYTLGLMANVFWGGEKEVTIKIAAPVLEEVPLMIQPPMDTDGDEVLDSDDKCPDTPAGSLVNEEGCPVVKVSVSLDVKFVSGKSALAPGTDEQLKKVSAFMQKHSDTTIVIEGHSDNVGGAAMNKKLSQQRADAVRKELVEKFGIAADRITAKGFGLEAPIADNATAEGRAANRRVVATLSASVVKK